MSVYDKIFPPRVLTLPNGKQVSKPRSRAPLAAVILVARRLKKTSARYRDEDRQEPKFHGPVYTVDYKDVDDELRSFASDLKKPTLEYPGDDTYIDAYSDFFDKIIG